MTTAELLTACKDGLGITTTAFDPVLIQKLLTVKGYLSSNGVSDAVLESDLAVGTLVLGVGDIWNLSPGEANFSKLFYTFATDLVAQSGLITVTATPADGSNNVSASVNPSLCFNKEIEAYSIALAIYNDETAVPITTKLSIDRKNVSITPAGNLMSATKYALIVTVTSTDGTKLNRTVITFTTA